MVGSSFEWNGFDFLYNYYWHPKEVDISSQAQSVQVGKRTFSALKRDSQLDRQMPCTYTAINTIVEWYHSYRFFSNGKCLHTFDKWDDEVLLAENLNDFHRDLSFIGYYDFSEPPKLLVENSSIRYGERADFIMKELYLRNDTLFYEREPSHNDPSDVHIYEKVVIPGLGGEPDW